MTDAEKNTVIAEAISPEREGWAWRKCVSCVGRGHYGPPTGKLRMDCCTCHGTGRVPVELHQPPYALMVVGWAARQEWWNQSKPKRHWTWMLRVESALLDFVRGRTTAVYTSGHIRDIIFEQLRAARIGTPNANTPKAGGKDAD